jgi:histidyl-tRNA synthetase
MISNLPPSGFRDFLPRECRARAKAAKIISEAASSAGFQAMETPAVEDLAVLTGKGSGENERLIFQILKRGEKLKEEFDGLILKPGQASPGLADSGLRFDLTVPLSRYYARHQGFLPHPFKAFHMGPVWRAERAQKGRYREFIQCDFDVLGSEDLACELDVVSTIVSALRDLGLAEGLSVSLNDRRVLAGDLREAGVSAEFEGRTLILLDKKDKMPEEVFTRELDGLLGEKTAKALSGALARDASSAAAEPLARLRDLQGSISRLCPWAEFKIDRGLVRGFDYYTGPVFEIRHPRAAGSIAGGGRYDGLIQAFGGRPTPAFGGSIGFERVMLLLEEMKGSESGEDGARVCVTIFSPELRGETFAAAARLRARGLKVDVCPLSGRLKSQFKYADATGARWAIVIGPDEAAAGRFKLKDLRSGEEALETWEELNARIQSAAAMEAHLA